MTHHLIAVDLGASNGRVILATLADGKLTLVEAHRFENAPLNDGGSLRWDLDALEREVRTGVDLACRRIPGNAPDGVACDSWGVDYVLLGENGRPLANPHHYRNRRTEGVMEAFCARFGRRQVFDRTGLQFLPFNTLYQFMMESPETLRRTQRVLMIADYFNYILGGGVFGEVSLASTTQMVDPRTRGWQPDLAAAAAPDAPLMRLLPRLVEAGTYLGDGATYASYNPRLPVYASASHDTAAAVAGCPGTGDDWAFLSSGTWSLLGVELPAPVVTEAALDANLSNELGVDGTTRLLKNICGLWPLQQCREEWAAAERKYSWDEIIALAEKAPPLAAVIDPDDARFLAPGDMSARIAAFCRETGQTPPTGVGEFARVILEGLALKCRLVLESIERVTGRTLRVINMVGGGTQNRLLCQLTADACGRPVVAGPVEATAAGNVMVQAIAVGAVRNLAAAREVIRRSFAPVTYDPHPSAAWDDACARLRTILKG
jgi:rhamnulokinase